jgi:hypothetical protein
VPLRLYSFCPINPHSFDTEMRLLKLKLVNKNSVLGFGTSVALYEKINSEGRGIPTVQDIPGHRPAKMAPKEG